MHDQKDVLIDLVEYSIAGRNCRGHHALRQRACDKGHTSSIYIQYTVNERDVGSFPRAGLSHSGLCMRHNLATTAQWRI